MFEYNYGYYPSYGSDGSVMAVLGLFVILMLIACSALPLVMYIIRSIALYRLSDRRGVGTPLLAWVPIASEYLLGQLTDEVDARRTGHNKKWAKSILITVIIGGCGVVFSYVAFMVLAFAMLEAEANYESAPAFVFVFFVTYLLLIFSLLLAYASAALRLICNFKLFEDVRPEKAVLYTILSITVPLAEPILLFKIKELGYEKPKPEHMFVYSVPYGYQPQAPQYQPQAPQYQPQAPQYQPQAPQYQPQAPQYQPQAPQYQPQAPQFVPEPPTQSEQTPPEPPQEM
jgi:hypothetical protein